MATVPCSKASRRSQCATFHLGLEARTGSPECLCSVHVLNPRPEGRAPRKPSCHDPSCVTARSPPCLFRSRFTMEDAQQVPAVDRGMKRRSLFRRSKGPPSRAPTPGIPDSTDVKKSRFSLFRGRRSGVVLDAMLFRASAASSPTSASSSDRPSTDRTSSEESAGGVQDVTDARDRALSILEGRPQSAAGAEPVATEAPPDRTGTNTPVGETVPVPASFIGALSMAFVSGRSRSGSVSSRRSLSADGPRVSSRLGLVPENSTVTTTRLTEEDEHGLPTYASAAYPSAPVAYRFAQAGPFAMVLTAGDEEDVPGLGRYHLSVGVNVLAPRSTVTSIRRGLSEDGPLVAQIE